MWRPMGKRTGGILGEAPLPQTPSPEERLAFDGCGSACLVPPVSWGRSPIGWCAITAADGVPRPSARFSASRFFYCVYRKE